MKKGFSGYTVSMNEILKNQNYNYCLSQSPSTLPVPPIMEPEKELGFLKFQAQLSFWGACQ
jgi:hypothetical protein